MRKFEKGSLFPEIQVPVPPERRKREPKEPDPVVDTCHVCGSINLVGFKEDGGPSTHRCTLCNSVGAPVPMLASEVIQKLSKP